MTAAAVEAMTLAVRGRVVTSADSDYDDARSVYNAMHDRKPRAIVQCVDSADVMAAIVAAATSGLDLAVRGGGHSVPGFGTVDDGLVIDLSAMRGVTVDPVKRTARVGGGATWGDVDHATYPFGLAAPGGIISTTGVGGLTLGGGIRYLTREVGLSIDNLLSADVVLADGRQVTASDYQNQDLFWALRDVAEVKAAHVGLAPFPALNSAFDGLVPKGLQHYWKADFVSELTDEAISQHIEHGKKTPCVSSTMHLYSINGAAQRLGADETAFGHRDKTFAPVIAGMWPDPADNAANTQWVKDYYAGIHPYSGSEGGYINFMSEDDDHRVPANYGVSYRRLAEVKAIYDPGNLFHVNQNIEPA